MQRASGMTLLEVLIAAIILSILVLGAMATMRSTTGFTVRSGRTNESAGRSFESWEPLRNDVAPPEEGLLPPGETTDTVTLTNVDGKRTRTITENPLNEDPNSAASQLKEATIHVEWNEPR